MKRIVILFCLLVALWVSRLFGGSPAEAHGSGPPYVLINNEYALGNPVLNIAQPGSFEVGADVASSSGYLTNQSISFAVDEQFFPNPYAQAQNPFGIPMTNAPDVPKPVFRWDFKDGTPPVEGLSVQHAFSKPGTYMVELAAKFIGKTDEYSVVDTIQMNVYPTKEYKFPQVKIVVDGTVIHDQDRDTTAIKPATAIHFTVEEEREFSSYHWDFGDGKGSEGKEVTHRYSRDEYFPVAVLRVVDEHNIAKDTYALLDMPFEKPNFFLGIWYAISDFLSNIFYKE